MIQIKPDPVTKPKRVVTKLSPSVTKAQGRPRRHESDAQRQKAYRERKKAEKVLRERMLQLEKELAGSNLVTRDFIEGAELTNG